jgi:hypothetical protein
LLLAFKRILTIIGNLSIFIKFEGIKASFLWNIYKIFIKKIKQQKINVLAYKVINKITHNGCRKKSK